jgi:hypothetical protein
MADQPGVVLAQPLQLRPIPLHLPPCDQQPAWVHGQPLGAAGGTGGGGSQLVASPPHAAQATPYPMDAWSPGASFYDVRQVLILLL